jgi:type IV secretion system protein VirB6
MREMGNKDYSLLQRHHEEAKGRCGALMSTANAILRRSRFMKLPQAFHSLAMNISTTIKIFLLTFFFLFSNIQQAQAKDTMDTIIDILSSLTCETQGVGDLLRSEFSHTCIPAPFFTFLLANMVSPGVYANTMLRVKINDEELFPGACKRENRIDFNDQKLSFAMCNNIKLGISRVVAVAKTAVYIAKALFTGEAPWDEIKNAWDIPESDYHNMFLNKREGNSGVMVDVGIIPIFPWKVIKENDKMCVATIAFTGWIPIGCKYIKEPFPISIYASFMDLSPDQGASNYTNPMSLTKCSNAGSCYKRALDNSKTGIVMTGPIIECVKEMTAKLMISAAVCSIDDINSVLGSSTRATSGLFKFQVGMHKAVTSLLTIYVILFGFRIVLSGNVPQKSEMVNFVIKFLFVVYFSVGINVQAYSGNDLMRLDGMVQWAFPFLLNGMTQLASWIISASPSELCKFYATDYAQGMSHMALWDSLDCRISHYLGLDMIQTMMVQNASSNHDFAKLDILSFPIPPYIYLLIPAVISGNFTLISLALMYPLMIISVGAFVVNATVVCIISIVVLSILAPLFVPMYLFEYTKPYFEAWVKLLISFMLQPMVAIVFMTTMLSVYDFGFYGACKYKYKELSFSAGVDMNVLPLNGMLSNYTPEANSGGRAIRYFYLDNDWGGYSEDDADSCVNSLGYILNNPLAWLMSTTKTMVTNSDMPWMDDASGNEEKKRFSFLDSISPSPGMFFNMVEVLFEKIKRLAISLLTACFTLYLMYHFSEKLAEFAADMTEGVSIGNMAIKPQAIYKAGMSALSAAKGPKGGGGGGGDVGGGATDKVSTGGGGSTRAGDKVSTGIRDKTAGDKVSTAEVNKDTSDKISTSKKDGGSNE